MAHPVEISFDCLPLRSVGRLDIPIDASPKYRERCLAIKHAIEKHGSHNTYYLYNASCTFHLTNNQNIGSLEFKFDGTVITNADDMQAQTADLNVELVKETCDWLKAPIVEWFAEAVQQAVAVEFGLYIQAGDLDRTKERIEKLQSEIEKTGGHVGMYL